MSRGVLDAAWPYFALAAVLAAIAVASQFRLEIPSREAAPVAALRELRERDDLNVVFLLVDTLRADRLGLYGYERPTSPNIDGLARSGIVFDRVVAQSSWTKTSMASLWTGTHPIHNGILRYNHVLPEAAVLPAEIFRAAGFRTVGLWRNGWVEPNFGFAQGFDTYVRPAPGASRAEIQRRTRSPHPLIGTDEDLTLAALDFLERFGEERFFLYLHYMDLHQYVYEEQSARFGTSYSDAYDQSLHWTDRLIGALLLALERQGVLDRTLVVIASDHGEAFLEHGYEGHARNLYEEVTHVPLILLPPFLLEPGVRVATTISNADVWPTLLDIVGLPALPSADGVSMLPLILEAGGESPGTDTQRLERPVFAQLARGWGNPKLGDRSTVSVTWQGKRLIAHLDELERAELYDHRLDPGEANDLFSSDPQAAEPLLALVREYEAKAKPAWGAAPGQVELDELRLNQLRALGYLIDP
ncbi:MAG TPA: sulfatase [Myxococcota bacterium]